MECLAFAVALGAELDDHHRGGAQFGRAIHLVWFAYLGRVDEVREMREARVLEALDVNVFVLDFAVVRRFAPFGHKFVTGDFLAVAQNERAEVAADDLRYWSILAAH